MLQFREHGPTSRPQEAGERFLRPKMVANLVELQVWNPSLLFFFFHFLNWQIPNEKHAWEKIIIKKYKKKEIGEVEDDGEIEKLETFCMEPRNFVPSPIHEEKI